MAMLILVPESNANSKLLNASLHFSTHLLTYYLRSHIKYTAYKIFLYCWVQENINQKYVEEESRA